MEIKIKDDVLQKAAVEGMDEFVAVFVSATLDAIGGELNADNMAGLNSDQVTLLAWHYLHEEVMDGGFIELIHDGYGPFIYLNPTDKAFRQWGISELYKIINKSHRFYNINHDDIEKDCTDEEFMALYEKYPEFDDFDDAFVLGEMDMTRLVAQYIDNHIDNFAIIEK